MSSVYPIAYGRSNMWQPPPNRIRSSNRRRTQCRKCYPTQRQEETTYTRPYPYSSISGRIITCLNLLVLLLEISPNEGMFFFLPQFLLYVLRQPYFMYTVKWAVMQYVIIRPAVSLAGIICQSYGVLCGSIGFGAGAIHFANIYLQAIDFVSITWVFAVLQLLSQIHTQIVVSHYTAFCCFMASSTKNSQVADHSPSFWPSRLSSCLFSTSHSLCVLSLLTIVSKAEGRYFFQFSALAGRVIKGEFGCMAIT